MSKANWLSPDEIRIVSPTTPEQMDALEQDILSIATLLPFCEPDFISGGMRNYPEQFTVAYHGDKPIGYIEVNDDNIQDYLDSDTLEFGGAVLPEYRIQGITQQVAPHVIRKAFERTTAKQMITIVPSDNQGAINAICALGFKRFDKTPDGKLIYKLDRNDILA